jgi:hypothetical protein
LAGPVNGASLDLLVARVLERSPFDYRLAADDAERRLSFRLRGQVVVNQGWRTANDLPGGLERDEYDDRALHVLGWDGDVVMSTGRIVLPPGLPTEDACGIVVDPPGEVVDVGRMCVLPGHQGLEHAALIGLMCRLYLEMRAHAYEVACGMMSARAQVLVRHLGLKIQRLGAERPYWGEPRWPVRFSLLSNAAVLESGSWRGPS